MSEEKNLIKKLLKKKIKHLEKQLAEKLNDQQCAVNISNQPNPRTDKKTVIAIDNYNTSLKEYDNIYTASKDLQINSGIILYPCKICISLKRDIRFVIKNHLKKKIYKYII